MEFVDLVAERRTERRKAAAKRLRRAGRIPAVLYGEGEPLLLSVSPKALQGVLEAGENVIINLQVKMDGGVESRKVLVKELQIDPVREMPLHADFLGISMTRVIAVKVPVELTGIPVGVTTKGGILEHALWELEVKCLPAAIPERVTLDVSALDLGDALHVKDLKVPEGVVVEADPEQVVAMVSAPRVEAEEPVTPEVPAEPELVGRKAEAEEPEGEEGAKEPAKKGAAPPKAEAAKKPEPAKRAESAKRAEPAKRAEAPRKEKEKEGK
ncbi:MAG: 50S ribosomal protein L25 [Candidatus Methylomirabilales bacterium]